MKYDINNIVLFLVMLYYVSECNEPMVGGSTGVLRPRESFVTATFSSSGFTQFTLPAGQNSFTLESNQGLPIRITRFLLRVSEVCSDGSALSVRVDYITKGNLVSLKIFHNFICYFSCECSFISIPVGM